MSCHISDDVAAAIAAAYAGGNIKAATVGATYGCAERTVIHIARRFGVPPRKSRGPGNGQLHHNWKGEDIAYAGAHKRVSRIRGVPSLCENCGATEGRFEWASLTGSYTNVWDYKRLCASCHRRFDLDRTDGMRLVFSRVLSQTRGAVNARAYRARRRGVVATEDI